MAVASRSLGEFLVARGTLSPDQLEWGMAREAESGTPLAAVLLGHQLVTEKDVLAGAAAQMGIPFVDFAKSPARPAMAHWLTEDAARRVGAVAVDLRGTALVVAISDPTDQQVLDWLTAQTGLAVEPALASAAEIQQALDILYPEDAARRRPVAKLAADALPVEPEPNNPPATKAAAAPAAPRVDSSSLDVDTLLHRVVSSGGSDLHLSAGLPPSVRINGEISPIAGFGPLTADDIERMVFAMLTDKQRAAFAEELELDTSHEIDGVGRFRVNVFVQRNAIGSVMRVIPFAIPEFASLGLPTSVASLANLARGLVLVTGPTGSGKSTTLASLIDIINSSRSGHIITVEDPIEFLHTHKRSVVNQREVGEDTRSFATALKHALRQDPDVILVGEMRDLETISTALTAAETGHLVFGTLHTQSAPQSVDRIIDVFPAHQQQQVRSQLAAALQGVVTQQLIPNAQGAGRVVASEVLIVTPAVRNLIREGKSHQVPTAMQSGGRYGMQTMDQSLAQLVRQRTITMDTALERCHSAEDLQRLVSGG